MRSKKLSWMLVLCAGLVACGDDAGDDGDGKTERDAAPVTAERGDAGRLDAGEPGEEDVSNPSLGDAARPGDAAKPSEDTGDAATTDPDDDVKQGEACEETAFGGLGKLVGVCEGCGAEQCLAVCKDGVYGPCQELTDALESLQDTGVDVGDVLDILGDAGPRGGSGNLFGDGGFAVNEDAGVEYTDEGIPYAACPAQSMCTTSASGGVTAVITEAVGIGFCTDGKAPQACTKPSDCAGYGASICFDGTKAGGGTEFALTLIGWPKQFCVAPCQ